MTLPHLTRIELLLKTYTFRATFKAREQGQHTGITSNKTSTHQAKQSTNHIIGTTRASSTMVVILNGTLEMMIGHQTFKQDKIRNLLVKTTQIKNQGSKK
jgi:hypothetical protein